MKRVINILIICFFYLSNKVISQELVIDSDFESAVNILPNQNTEDLCWAIAEYWQDSSWSLYSSKHAVIYRNRKISYNGKQVGVIRIYNSFDSYNDFLQTKFKTNLIKGEVYELSFFVKLFANSSDFVTTSSLTCLLSEKVIDFVSVDSIYRLKPNLKNQNELFFNKKEWIKVSYLFKADSNYEYLIIGNLLRNNETRIKKIKFLRLLKKADEEIRVMIDCVSLVSKKSVPSFN